MIIQLPSSVDTIAMVRRKNMECVVVYVLSHQVFFRIRDGKMIQYNVAFRRLVGLTPPIGPINVTCFMSEQQLHQIWSLSNAKGTFYLNSSNGMEKKVVRTKSE